MQITLCFWLIFTLVGSLLSPISPALASSLQSNQVVWQNYNAFAPEKFQPDTENIRFSKISEAIGKDAITLTRPLPTQVGINAPSTFSLRSNSNRELLSKLGLAPLFSSWSSAIHINPSDPRSSSPTGAIWGNIAYAVWVHRTQEQLFLAKSVNGGQTWNTQNTQITNLTSAPSRPNIVINPTDGTIYVAFEHDGSIGLVRSADNGQTWLQLNDITTNYSSIFNFELGIDGSGNLYLHYIGADNVSAYVAKATPRK